MSEAKTNVVVLVADDEPSTLALVSAHVRSRGYTVLEASDGDLAWQLAHEHLPDLVVLDVMMPGMSGWEVCRKIREAVSLAHTGVVMLTGIGENLNEMTSPLYGADSYLDKPFEFSVLDERIAQVLAARQKGAMGRPDETASADRPNGMASKSSPPGAEAATRTAPARPKKAPKPIAKAKAAKKPAKPAKKIAKPAKKAAKKKTAKTKVASKPARAAKKVAKNTKKAKATGKAKAKAQGKAKPKAARPKIKAKAKVSKKANGKAKPKPKAKPKAKAKAPAGRSLAV